MDMEDNNNQPTTSGPVQGTNGGRIEEILSKFTSLNPRIMASKSYHAGYSWHQVLREPSFRTLDGFKTEIDSLEGVDEWETFAKDPLTSEMKKLDYKTLIGNKSRTVFTVASQAYRVVFDKDVFGPVFDAAKAMETDVWGRFDGTGSGRTVGHLFFKDPKFEFAPERNHEWTESPTMLGIQINNSYNTERSYGMSFFGVRKVCSNYCVWDKLLGSISFRHVGDLKNIAGAFEKMLEGVFESIGFIKKAMEEASDIVVPTLEVEDLLWGVGMPITGIEEVKEHPFEYVPEARKLTDMTLLDLYNGASAYITYRPRSALYLTSTRQYAKELGKLLKPKDYSRILEAGTKRRIAYEEAKTEKKTKKVAEPVAVTTGV